MFPLDLNTRLSMDEMPNDDLALVAKKCGLDVATKLILHLQGISIHVPRRALKKVTDKYIRENYNGHNVKELAVACGFSVRHVYGVLKEAGLLSRRSEGVSAGCSPAAPTGPCPE